MAEQLFLLRQVVKKLRLMPFESPGAECEIDLNEVKPRVDAVRKYLGDVCNEYMWYSTSNSSRDKERLKLLRLLAHRGRDLKKVIFPIEEDEEEQSQSSTVDDYTLLLLGPLEVHVPWGLLFDKPPRVNINSLSEPELSAGFWAMKHNVTAVYNPANRHGQSKRWNEPVEVALGTEGLLGVLHSRAIGRAGLVTWPNALRIPSSVELESRLLALEDDSLLYFFCHADEDVLKINDDRHDDLSPHRLKLIIETAQGRRGLVILNGCNTGVSHKATKKFNTWLETTRTGSFLGFVGTEVEVPTIFAWKLGQHLLRLMLVDGLTIRDAMRNLRIPHWPLSLLYGLYCIPHVTVRGSADFLKTGADNAVENYSLMFLGNPKDRFAMLPFGSLRQRKG